MINGSINFAISDYFLEFEKISLQLKLNPTKCIRKEQQISETRIAPYDVWLYQTKFQDEVSFYDELENLIEKLILQERVIIDFKKKYKEVVLDFYIRSDMGQLGFSLSSELLKKLSSLGINSNFHILSFGFTE